MPLVILFVLVSIFLYWQAIDAVIKWRRGWWGYDLATVAFVSLLAMTASAAAGVTWQAFR